MMTTKECIKYDMIVDLGIATANELNLARNLVNGTWEYVLDSVVYARTGYRTLEQYLECECEDYEDDIEPFGGIFGNVLEELYALSIR